MEARRKSDRLTVGRVLVALLGLSGIVGGALVVHGAIHQTPISEWVVGMGIGVAILGAAIISPDVMFNRLQRMVAAVRGAASAVKKPDV